MPMLKRGSSISAVITTPNWGRVKSAAVEEEMDVAPVQPKKKPTTK